MISTDVHKIRMYVPEVSLDKRYGGKRNHESQITLTAHQYALPSSDCGNGISDVVPHLSHERNPAQCTLSQELEQRA